MLSGWSDLGDSDSCSPPPSSSPTLNNGDTDESSDPNSSAILATMQTPNGRVSIPLLVPLLISGTTHSQSNGSFTITKPKSLFKIDPSDNTVVKRNFSSNEESADSAGGDEKIEVSIFGTKFRNILKIMTLS